VQPDKDQPGPPALPDATQLAVDRTRLAHDRTLLAWVRTATSMITFGFTIYKFFQYLRESERVALTHRLLGPRNFAMLMIAVGLAALVLATLQHHRDMRAMSQRYGGQPFSLAALLAAVVAGFGILALLSVALRQ
jgi:putative membrane protein